MLETENEGELRIGSACPQVAGRLTAPFDYRNSTIEPAAHGLASALS